MNRLLAHRLHALHKLSHQQPGITLALLRRVNHHRHNHHIRRLGRMPHQLLERLIRHHHLMRAAAVDKTHHRTIRLQNQKALGVLRNARGDLFQRRGFIAFVSADFDVKATAGIVGAGVAEGEGGHGRFLGR